MAGTGETSICFWFFGFPGRATKQPFLSFFLSFASSKAAAPPLGLQGLLLRRPHTFAWTKTTEPTSNSWSPRSLGPPWGDKNHGSISPSQSDDHPGPWVHRSTVWPYRSSVGRNHDGGWSAAEWVRGAIDLVLEHRLPVLHLAKISTHHQGVALRLKDLTHSSQAPPKIRPLICVNLYALHILMVLCQSRLEAAC